jgi:hypothetical protein
MATTPNYGFYLLTDADPQDAAVINAASTAIDLAIKTTDRLSVPPTTATVSVVGVTLGTGGTSVMDYWANGKMAFGRWRMVLGTGGAVSGAISPVFPAAIAPRADYVQGDSLGSWASFNGGIATTYSGAFCRNNAGNALCVYQSGYLTTGVPVAWAAGHRLSAQFSFLLD